MRKRLTPLEKEWELLLKKENQYLIKLEKERPLFLNEKLEGKAPPKLEETLHAAFCKAFSLVFLKGSGIIEKTYAREKQENLYKVNAYAADLTEDRKSLRAFHKQAARESKKGMLFSGLEGVGLGALGIGIPDIPLFTGMLLRNLYQIAMSYGYAYDTKPEQIFILKIIRTALEHGKVLTESNEGLNSLMESLDQSDGIAEEMFKEELEKTSGALAEELLYLKFLQGIPIAGVVGGFYDAVYLKKISDYAALKYKRRFLLARFEMAKEGL